MYKRIKCFTRFVNDSIFSSGPFGSLEAFIFWPSLLLVLTCLPFYLMFSSNTPKMIQGLLAFGISGLSFNLFFTHLGAVLTLGDDFPVGRIWKSGQTSGSIQGQFIGAFWYIYATIAGFLAFNLFFVHFLMGVMVFSKGKGLEW